MRKLAKYALIELADLASLASKTMVVVYTTVYTLNKTLNLEIKEDK